MLAPTYLNSVPDDPLGGGAGVTFHYKPLNNGKRFLLYSLGDNLRDDGGAPGRFPGDKGPFDLVAGKLQAKHWVKP